MCVSSDDDKKRKVCRSRPHKWGIHQFISEGSRASHIEFVHTWSPGWLGETKNNRLEKRLGKCGREAFVAAGHELQNSKRNDSSFHSSTSKLFISYQIPSGVGFLNKTFAASIPPPATRPRSHTKIFVVVSINVMYVDAVCINLLCISSYLIECFIIQDIVMWLFCIFVLLLLLTKVFHQHNSFYNVGSSG